MHKGKIKWEFKNFRIYKDLYGKPCQHDWVGKVVFLIQLPLTFSAVTIATFEIHKWNFSGCLILICSFSLCYQNFSKVNCFLVYRKLITWSSHARSLFTGKNNRFPFLDTLGYLKNTHKNPKFGKVRQVPTREFPTKFPDWDLSHSSKFGIFVGIL